MANSDQKRSGAAFRGGSPADEAVHRSSASSPLFLVISRSTADSEQYITIITTAGHMDNDSIGDWSVASCSRHVPGTLRTPYYGQLT